MIERGSEVPARFEYRPSWDRFEVKGKSSLSFLRWAKPGSIALVTLYCSAIFVQDGKWIPFLVSTAVAVLVLAQLALVATRRSVVRISERVLEVENKNCFRSSKIASPVMEVGEITQPKSFWEDNRELQFTRTSGETFTAFYDYKPEDLEWLTAELARKLASECAAVEAVMGRRR
jgi:hypothetical protein